MKRIVFCGGGSYGHVMPNVAIIDKLKTNYEIFYIGTSGVEKSICQNYSIHFFECDAVKFVRGKLFTNLRIPFTLIKSTARAKKILKKLQPDLVFCKGGYACLPTALAASSLKIKIMTHESDISLGLANKIIARRCVKVLTSFPDLASKLKRGIYVGSPMREEIFGGDKKLARRKFDFDEKPVILVLGGGSGSRAINECVRQVLPELTKRYNVLHICGKGNLCSVNIDGYRQIEYCYNMSEAYAVAEFALSRCGSGAAHELLALKIPTLFIPLENKRSRGDQIKNAEYFENLGLCHVLRQSELSIERLLSEVERLVGDNVLKESLKRSHIKNGTEAIAREISTTIYASE